MAYVFPVMIVLCLCFLELSRTGKVTKFISSVCVFLFAGAIVHQVTGASYENAKIIDYYSIGYETSTGGGLLCGTLAKGLAAAFGVAGVYIISGVVIIVCLLLILEFYRLFKKENKPASSRSARPESAKKETVKREAQDEYVKKNKGMRSRYKEQEVYKTEEDGTVIRIVHTPESSKMKRAQMKRTQNRATSMRNEPVQVRSNTKRRGISDDLDIEKKMDRGDDVHEITNARPKEAEAVPAETVKKKPSVRVRDVSDNTNERQPEKAKNSQKTPDVRNTSLKGQNFSLPPISLLGKKKARPKPGEDTEKTARSLEYVLEQFGVYARVVNIQTGPSVTRYELQPEMGTRVSKFTSLADDLKLNLAVPEIRIEAPVPGKSVVGIEIPNKNVQPVTLRELLDCPELEQNTSKLAFAAGRSISGDIVVGDIATMPHLLIAGTTGSGKSVFTKSIIMEILYRTTPDEVGLIVIDPKKVEFNVFEGIPNLMKSVVTDPGQAVSTLRWAVNEMMVRYERMNKCGVNNIQSYNKKIAEGRVEESGEYVQKMPQILIVIDELADLMMTAKKEVESYICRLAQLSRAAGIHMVIATQRPSADVVTGLIKTNIPSRVALKVASGIDSRIILDTMGAEKLLGRGDMLFYPNGYSSPVRIQGAFVTDKEVADTVAYLRAQRSGNYYADTEREIEEFINTSVSEEADPEHEQKKGAGKYDEYFHDAGLACIEMGRASSSMLQRRFNLGFNRAARIIDQLCEAGVVGPANGSKPREILVDSMTFEEMYEELIN